MKKLLKLHGLVKSKNKQKLVVAQNYGTCDCKKKKECKHNPVE